MAKRGELKPYSEWEENIRSNAEYFNVIGWRPGGNRTTHPSFCDLTTAKAYAKELVKDTNLRLRTSMVYAIGEYENFTLVGSYTRDGQWKPVLEDRY